VPNEKLKQTWKRMPMETRNIWNNRGNHGSQLSVKCMTKTMKLSSKAEKGELKFFLNKMM